ncbi:hypothetical protein BKA67DRAFT_534272 [Truncatella angustata]|uniref:Uncharacterized protein n=1 Tax=Truncatella angustata TaxID=152316 RepID=A0A9P8ZYS7_9PEZI|nr:uncharacterized protein BKA67DRAFT_534272 [Truncatella angustata]KAH6655343.1 hypothetical protein BKA67DRAFT_534272 [Truncatella angustata]
MACWGPEEMWSRYGADCTDRGLEQPDSFKLLIACFRAHTATVRMSQAANNTFCSPITSELGVVHQTLSGWCPNFPNVDHGRYGQEVNIETLETIIARFDGTLHEYIQEAQSSGDWTIRSASWPITPCAHELAHGCESSLPHMSVRAIFFPNKRDCPSSFVRNPYVVFSPQADQDRPRILRGEGGLWSPLLLNSHPVLAKDDDGEDNKTLARLSTKAQQTSRLSEYVVQ